MPNCRSPLALVAAVVFAASILLALTLPNREPEVGPCPIGRIDPTGRCGLPVDHRTPERAVVVLAGAVLAAGLLVAARRIERPPPPRPGGSEAPGEPPAGTGSF
jgi:hypothetical protein